MPALPQPMKGDGCLNLAFQVAVAHTAVAGAARWPLGAHPRLPILPQPCPGRAAPLPAPGWNAGCRFAAPNAAERCDGNKNCFCWRQLMFRERKSTNHLAPGCRNAEGAKFLPGPRRGERPFPCPAAFGAMNPTGQLGLRAPGGGKEPR